jgi:PKD repeat protein
MHSSTHRRPLVALLTLTLLFQCGLGAFVTSAQTLPLKFEVATVDAATGATKTGYYLGERVSAVFSFTNLSGAALTMPVAEQLEISVKLSGTINRSDRPALYEGVRGGRGGAQVDPDGTVYFTGAPLIATTVAAGQKVVVRIDDLAGFFGSKLADGSYTLSAVYGGSQQAQATFTVAIEEARSVPVLEQLAAGSDPDAKAWANSFLDLIRKPSINGRILVAEGLPLPGVTINVTGSDKTNIDTRADGNYELTHLTSGGTYTLTPSLEGYTFEPAQRTYTGLTSKVTGANFNATRARAGVNVASEEAGAVATASSTLDEDFPVESVINGSKTGIGWGQGSGGWNDATHGLFPDWVEVNFGAFKYINWINVFTLQDNFENPSDPTQAQTFTLYGITDFDVQYWDGATWVNVPGGTVNANSNVWRRFDFPTIGTSKIRVYIRGAKDGHSRITEIEAFHANAAPKIKFFGLYQGAPGSTFNFNYSGSDSDGFIARYEWDFGDNTTATGPTQSHTYTNVGTYTVSLRVTDDGGESYTARTTVKIADPAKPPVASTGGTYQGSPGKDVLFDGMASSDSDGTIASYAWNFGDGASGSGPTPAHAYAQAGTYNVSLTVTDNSGMTATATTTANITTQPTVATPTNLLATTNASGQVEITWSSTSPPHHYQIERATSLNGTFVALGATPTTNSHTDSSMSPNGVYFYRVCAVDASGNKSGYTNIDVAANYAFTDPALLAGVTFVKAQHVTELRQAIDAMRLAVGLQPAAWTDAELSNVFIKAVHVLELRTNLDQALTQVGVPAVTYTDPQLAIGYLIRKAHIEELRLRLN